MLLYSIWKSVKRNLLNIKWNQTTCGSMPSQIKSLTAIYTAWKFHIFNNLTKSDKQKIKSINSLLAFLALLSSRMFFAMQNPLFLFGELCILTKTIKLAFQIRKCWLFSFWWINVFWGQMFTIIDRLR